MIGKNEENHMNDLSYAGRPNGAYLEELFEKFQKNPKSVDPDWARFFEGVEFGRGIAPAIENGTTANEVDLEKEMNVLTLISAYRDIGHIQANTNVLYPAQKRKELSLERFNLCEEDLSRKFLAGTKISKPYATLGEILKHLEHSYCGNISVEYAGVTPDMRAFVIKEFESPSRQFSKEEKKEIFKDLNATDALEKFFQMRYVGLKRFSIEGADAIVPMLATFVYHGTETGLEEIVITMAHRGRINVLTNFMGKALELVFSEFDGRYESSPSLADGDVKYHLGFSADKSTPHGNCHISLAFNPSHLEATLPVSLGITRAKQRIRKDENRRKVVPIIIHGDAAVIAQGVVSESLQLSELPGYTIGGSIHIVIDNQIGFTTSAESARSTRYCTDVVKQISAPVIHVNGDDVESCIRAMNFALHFRQKFSRDIIIGLSCYRRHGHNEGDEPTFTQPLMYEKIRKHPCLREIYGKKLIEEGLMTQKELDKIFEKEMERLQHVLEESRKKNIKPYVSSLEGSWSGLRRAKPEDFTQNPETGVSVNRLKEIVKTINRVPGDFSLHPKIKKLLEFRTNMMEKGESIDWGMGEILAYGSLLQEGYSVRITGQDVCRGTFSHRQIVYTDGKTEENYCPLSNEEYPHQAKFSIFNSPLSEYAVLGFEYGNSVGDPSTLIIWEAQFGDFANGAQIIIDQFICSAESKWQRMNGLVLFLPHGYEGQGPEHSNARPERFLQLCAQYNMQVLNCSTPAQLFHALRRQIKRDFRKPLIVMTPKALLRHPKVTSSLQDFEFASFQEVLPDPHITVPTKVETCILCSGKIYYDLLEGKEKLAPNKKEIALIRLEQYYPFPDKQLIKVLSLYSKAKKLIWAQEEPQNMGAYAFIAPKLQMLLQKNKREMSLSYRGRTERASPAIGSMQLHIEEQEAVIRSCFLD